MSGTSVPVTPDSQENARVSVVDGVASVGHRDGGPSERAAWDCTPAGTNRHTVYTDSALPACKHQQGHKSAQNEPTKLSQCSLHNRLVTIVR